MIVVFQKVCGHGPVCQSGVTMRALVIFRKRFATCIVTFYAYCPFIHAPETPPRPCLQPHPWRHPLPCVIRHTRVPTTPTPGAQAPDLSHPRAARRSGPRGCRRRLRGCRALCRGRALEMGRAGGEGEGEGEGEG